MYWTEKNKLKKWAIQNAGKESFPIIDKEMQSYYTDFDNKDSFTSYDLTSIPELKNFLHVFWSEDYMQEIIGTCAVAAFKNKPCDKLKEDLDQKYILSDYVYVF